MAPRYTSAATGCAPLLAAAAAVSYATRMGSLGPRLSAVAGFVARGRPMADVGTDHARLPVTLVRDAIVPWAIACDVHASPLEAARRTVLAAGCQDRVHLRLGDGLAPLRPGEIATVVIAGMGGRSITEILAAPAAATVVGRLERLVLAPNRGVERVRRHLDATAWTIVDEAMVEEAGRLYPIVMAAPGRAAARADPVDLVVGPRLRHRADPAVRAWLDQELARTRRALEGLRGGRAHDPTKAARLEALAALLSDQLAKHR